MRRQPTRRSGRDPGSRPYAPVTSRSGKPGRKHYPHSPCRLGVAGCLARCTQIIPICVNPQPDATSGDLQHPPAKPQMGLYDELLRRQRRRRACSATAREVVYTTFGVDAVNGQVAAGLSLPRASPAGTLCDHPRIRGGFVNAFPDHSRPRWLILV